MISTPNVAVDAAPAVNPTDARYASKPSRKRVRPSSETHKKPAASSPSTLGSEEAGDTATADAPAPSDAGDTVHEQPRQSKASVVEALLTREGGASLEALFEATGWKAHTCRAVLTGLRTKGREVIRARGKDGKSIYLIEPDRSAASSPEAKQVEVGSA